MLAIICGYTMDYSMDYATIGRGLTQKLIVFTGMVIEQTTADHRCQDQGNYDNVTGDDKLLVALCGLPASNDPFWWALNESIPLA
jgi:hypothetical protein